MGAINGTPGPGHRRLTLTLHPAYTLVHLFSNYKFDNDIDLGVKVSNL